jgi:beta-lactamase regulating signal transducer with metallopeptidase domain
MTALAGWYPGESVVLAGLELLGMVTVLVGLTWAAESVVAHRRAALRTALWTAALIGVMLAPAWVWLGRQLPWRVVVRPRESAAVTRSDVRPPLPTTPVESRVRVSVPVAVEPKEPLPVSTAPSPHEASTVPPPSTTEKPSAPATIVPPVNPLHALATAVVGVWALGSVYPSLRLFHGWLRVRRLWRRARPLHAGRWAAVLTDVAHTLSVNHLPAVCVSPDVRSPLVAGLFWPRVVLPASLLEVCMPDQLVAVLVHECAHIIRHDPWGRLLQRLAVILYWVHPLVHLLNRKLDQAREEVCDNHVLARTEPIEYAETLLTVAQFCQPVPGLEGYLAMLPRRQSLETRVASLLHDRRDTATCLPTRQWLAVLAALVLAVVAGSSVGFQRTANASDVADQSAPPTQPPAATAKAAAPAATGRITGRVVDADDRPVARADVRVKDVRWAGDPPPFSMRRTTTNVQGEFTFDAVPPGQFRLWAFHGDSSSRVRMLQGENVIVERDGASRPVVLTMRPVIAVRVRVLSQADGKPIAGARVRLIWTDTDRDHITDANGVVNLPPLTPETWHLDVVAKDCAKVIHALNLANDQPTELDVKLPPGGTLEGVVKDERGRPLKDVSISAFREDYMHGSGSFEDVESDAEGRYRLDHMPLEQTLTLMFHKVDYLRDKTSFRLDAGAGRSTRLDLTLTQRPHGGSVQGVVTDEQGKPIVGAELVNEGGPSWEVRKATTDAQGKFVLDNVYGLSGGHHLAVRAKGYAPQGVEFKPGPAAQPAELAVKLAPGHRVEGRVINAAGQPIPGVQVFFGREIRRIGADIGGYAMTDSQGRFRFDSLPEQTPFNFRADGYADPGETTLALDGDKEVVVTLKALGVIQGRVVDAVTERPISRFTIQLTFSPDRGRSDQAAGISSSRFDPGEVVSSPEGRFLLNGLTVGAPYQVSVTADGYRRRVLRRVVAHAAPAAQAEEIRLTAEDPSSLVTLRDKLVNSRGEGVRGVDLRLIVAAGGIPRTDPRLPYWELVESGQLAYRDNVLQFQRKTTAADGSFEFQRVPTDAETELAYWGRGVPHGRVEHLEQLADNERANLVIKAPASARVTGTIDRAVYPEISNIHVNGRSIFYRATVAADGKSFTVEDMLPGVYQIYVYGPSNRLPGKAGDFGPSSVGRLGVTLQEGQEAKVTLGVAERMGRRAP